MNTCKENDTKRVTPVIAGPVSGDAYGRISVSKKSDVVSLIDCTEVAKLLGIGVSTVWAWTRAGRIPQPIKLGSRTTRWKTHEIQNYIESISGVGDESY